MAGAANRFVAALATGDGDALYALQTEAYKQTCSREDFDTVVAALKTQPLQGPAKVDLQGNNAAVALRTSDGQQVVLPMKKESDGTWRVVARVRAAASERSVRQMTSGRASLPAASSPPASPHR